jgi:hypothetical protein
MRSQVKAAVTAFILLTTVLAAAPPSNAAAGSPQFISVDCDLAAGVTATTITGNVGDTVIIDNTAGSGDGCTFTSFLGVVTASNLNAGVLPAGATSTVTIIAAGTFTVTPRAIGGGGTSTQMAVVIGSPITQAEYVITFDANGGNCSSNPLVVTALSGEWYGLPSDGSGSFQCQRPFYKLIGWSHGSTLLESGQAARVPDLALPAPSAGPALAAAADHATLYAIWQPLGVEIVYDANVALQDACNEPPEFWYNAPASRRTMTSIHYFADEWDRWDSLATFAPCSPPGPARAPLTLAGWALSGDGPIAHPPGQLLGATGFTPGTSVTLYAVWSGLSACDSPPSPSVNLSGCNLSGVNLENANLAFANLAGANLSNASLNFATMSGANLMGANLSGASIEGTGLNMANLEGANLQNANLPFASLNGANLTNANLTGATLLEAELGGANLTGATLTGADLSFTLLGFATWTDGSRCGESSVGSCTPWQPGMMSPPNYILE